MSRRRHAGCRGAWAHHWLGDRGDGIWVTGEGGVAASRGPEAQAQRPDPDLFDRDRHTPQTEPPWLTSDGGHCVLARSVYNCGITRDRLP